jgi:hypothetical protein
MPFQKYPTGRLPDHTAVRPGGKASTGQVPGQMPCNVGDDASYPPHYYFSHQPEQSTASNVGAPEASSKFYKDPKFCEAVVQQYTLLETCHSLPHAFSHLTNDLFFGRDPFCLDPPVQGHPSAVKVNTSATIIKHKEWLAPPGRRTQCERLPQSLASTYWLSGKASDRGLSMYLDKYTCVLGGNFMFPYLTVDFRNGGEEMEETRRRGACNGSQALFNRYRLYAKAREVSETPAKARDDSLHCHFMIVFDGREYEGWRITLDKDEGWSEKGCTMRMIFESTLRRAECVRGLYEWIYQIHRWAESKYGPACIEEIRTCLGPSILEEVAVGVAQQLGG